MYLYQAKRDELSIGYAVGYPEELAGFRQQSSEGLLGRVVTTQQPVVVGDATSDPHAIGVVPGMASALAVPLIHKAQSIGVLNLLSREPDRYSERDVVILRQFAAHVATALVNARLFERQRLDAEAFETLAEIGREVAALLDLEELLSRIVKLAPRLIEFRTFGILLLNEATQELELKVGVQYGERSICQRCASAKGWSATPPSSARPCWRRMCRRTPDTSRSSTMYGRELVVPMLIKDRCIGVLDLESPELDAFSRRDIEILTLLASQAAVAIENARLLRGAVGQRGTPRAGAADSRNASRRPCCRRSCRSASRASTSPPSSLPHASSAATSTTSSCRTRRRSPWPSETSPARASRPRSTPCSQPNWCAAGRSAAGTSRSARLPPTS